VGPGCNCDTDGNEDEAPPDAWTELTVALRPVSDQQRVDVDPLDDREPLVLVIRQPLVALKAVNRAPSEPVPFYRNKTYPRRPQAYCWGKLPD
jgi:hypothetical protein